jgi:hypothetical protein
LASDQAKLQADLAAARDTIKSDSDAARTKLEADAKAIHDLLVDDSGVVTAKAKLTSDLSVFAADYNTFKTDRAAYLSDRSTNPTA